MNLETISYFILATLIVISLVISCNQQKVLLRELKKTAHANDLIPNYVYRAILSNLPVKIKLSSKNEIVYTNSDENKNIFERVLEIKNKNKNHIQNIIVEGEPVSFKILEQQIKIEGTDYCLITLENINSEEQIKRELNGYIRMYRDLLDASSHGIAFYSKDMRLVFYNDVFKNIWHLDKKWLETRPFFVNIIDNFIEKNFISESDAALYKKEQINMFHNLTDTHNDFMHLADEKIIRVLIVPNSSGGLLFSYEDITNKLVVEKSYNHLMKIYRNVMEQMDEGVAIFSPNCRLYLYNKKFLNLFDFEKKHLDEKPHLSSILNKLSFTEKNSNDLLTKMTNMINKPAEANKDTFIFEHDSRTINLKIIKTPEDLILFLFEDN